MKKVKQLYVNGNYCVDAQLMRNKDGSLFIYWYWLMNHGIGSDNRLEKVITLKDLEKFHAEDVKIGWISKQEAV